MQGPKHKTEDHDPKEYHNRPIHGLWCDLGCGREKGEEDAYNTVEHRQDSDRYTRRSEFKWAPDNFVGACGETLMKHDGSRKKEGGVKGSND